MKLTPGNADIHALKIIELLVQQGHYSALSDRAVEQIGKDANALAELLTSSEYRRP